jgi:anti-sigma B factor antagonist
MALAESAPPDAGRLIVTVDEVDQASCDIFREEVLDAVSRYLDAEPATGSERRQPLLIDLTHVAFLDSSGVRVIIDADAAARAGGGRLRLVAAQRCVAKVLRVTEVWDHINDDVAP